MYLKKISELKKKHKEIVLKDKYKLVCEIFNLYCGDKAKIYYDKENFLYIIRGTGCVLFESSCQILNNLFSKKKRKADTINEILYSIKDIKNIFSRNYDIIFFKIFYIYKNIKNRKRFNCVFLPWSETINFFLP